MQNTIRLSGAFVRDQFDLFIFVILFISDDFPSNYTNTFNCLIIIISGMVENDFLLCFLINKYRLIWIENLKYLYKSHRGKGKHIWFIRHIVPSSHKFWCRKRGNKHRLVRGIYQSFFRTKLAIILHRNEIKLKFNKVLYRKRWESWIARMRDKMDLFLSWTNADSVLHRYPLHALYPIQYLNNNENKCKPITRDVIGDNRKGVSKHAYNIYSKHTLLIIHRF